MKQYFRLLLISFGLLLLLGISAHPSEDTAHDEPTTSISISFSDQQAALVPVASTFAPMPLVSPWWLTPQGQHISPAKIEFITSTGIRSRLHFYAERFMEYSPLILLVKGIPVNLPDQKDESFLA